MKHKFTFLYRNVKTPNKMSESLLKNILEKMEEIQDSIVDISYDVREIKEEAQNSSRCNCCQDDSFRY